MNFKVANHEGLSYLARTDKRGAQGAGVPVLGRFGTVLPGNKLRLSPRGVIGESSAVVAGGCCLRLLTLDFLVPEENISYHLEDSKKRDASSRV